MRLLHKGESLCCFRDSTSVTYVGMLPSDLTLSALRFILSAKSGQSCKQDHETVDFYNSLLIGTQSSTIAIMRLLQSIAISIDERSLDLLICSAFCV